MTGRDPVDGPHAIVIGLESLVGLQAARILSERGVPVIAITHNPKAPYCRTRVCEEILVAEHGSDELIAQLESLGPRLKRKAVLFPCTDVSVLQISRSRDRLEEWFHVVLADPDVVELLIDKVRFYAHAEEAGLPIPGTHLLRTREDAEKAAREMSFPCIVKPPMKTPGWEEHATAGVYKVANPAELLNLYDHCHGWTDLLMAQEWVEGTDADLFSCNCYFDASSEPLVTFVARKLRQWPPEAGVSSLGEECRNDIVLRESIRLFESVGYRGLGYVEMKRDARTGEHYIIEPNIGRPTGRSPIAEAGGVELLYTMYCDAIGWPLPEGRRQQYGGAKWIYWRRDLQAALFYWRRGDLSLREWARSLRGKKRCAVFSLRDPVPFIADLVRVAGLLLSRKDGVGAARPVESVKSPSDIT